MNADAPKDPTRPEVFAFVPSYNHEAFVEQTLRSIFAQTLHPKKLLVIDDGSGDNSPALIERTLKDCPFDSELLVRENRGLCRTLNEGLSKATEDYFAYISSDDVWLPNFLESRTALLDRRRNAVLAYGHAFIIDDENYIFDRTDSWSDYVDGKATEMLLVPVIPTSASVVYRRSALVDDPWHEDAILEDYDLYLRLSMKGEFALGEPMLSAWRVHGSNTSADSPLMMEEWLRAQERLADQLGLSQEKLTRIRERVKFESIATLARTGHKTEAAELLRQIGESFPLISRFKMRLRIAMPDSVYRFKRRTKISRARRRSVKLNI